MNQVITVSQINTYIKSLLDGSTVLNHIYLSGEISNLTDHYRSGHLYLSLKDDRSVIKAVMFSSAAKRLRFKPADGMKVLVRGRISVYEVSGQYQVYIEDMQPDGLGALNLAFEQLKEKLSQEGLFSSEYKKPLPAYPAKIAVITSPTGAAVQDILRILGRRWPVAEVVLCPCAVQGQSAVPELVRSIKAVNQGGEADVIIIGRGGGALEDLWAFNHEELARAIFASHIPVVSAVGHETDFTICDFVSDVRASTPSAAAELVTPDIEDEKARLKAIRNTLNAVIQQKIADCSMRLDSVPSMTELGSKVIRHKNEQVMNESKLLLFLSRNHIAEEKNCFAELAGKLDALSPLKVLERGYAVLTHNGQAIHSVNSLDMGETLTAILSDGELDVTVNCLRRENNER